MNLRDYQVEIEAFAHYPANQAIDYCFLGLIGEAGELANQVKKIIRDDAGVVTPMRTDKLVSEAGDVLWYTTRLATHDDWDLSDYQPAATLAGITTLGLTLIGATLELNRVVNALADRQADLQEVFEALSDFAYIIGSDIEELADCNLKKLTGRLERGTLGGSGDDR